MKSNDSYPPDEEGSDKQQKVTPLETPEVIEVEQNKKTGNFEEEITGMKIKRSVSGATESETHEYFKRTHTYSKNEIFPAVEENMIEAKEIHPVMPAEEKKKEKIQEDEDDESEEWDGSEAEIVLDDEAEEYEEETTGIKIKYALRSSEVQEFIKHTEMYKKNRRTQKKHTVVQSIIFAAMAAMSIFLHNEYYLWLAAFPIFAILLIWVIPFFKIKQITKEMFERDEISVEIFPDEIEVQHADYTQKILLDGSCESEEYGNLILFFLKDEIKLIIPIRAIEPEFLADVQAMIFAGTKPRYKD